VSVTQSTCVAEAIIRALSRSEIGVRVSQRPEQVRRPNLAAHGVIKDQRERQVGENAAREGTFSS